jgi:uncharacterized protein (DUF362 family)
MAGSNMRFGFGKTIYKRNPGCYVKPEITLAVVRMCLDAGAKEVGVIKQLDNAYWRRSAISNSFRDERRSIRFIGDNFTEVPFPHGRSLKKAEIAKGMVDCDVLINVPIAKHQIIWREHDTSPVSAARHNLAHVILPLSS